MKGDASTGKMLDLVIQDAVDSSICGQQDPTPAQVIPPGLLGEGNERSGLTEADYRALEGSWITRQLAEEAGVRRVSSAEGARIVGRDGKGEYAGLVFPYRWPGETRTREYRLRRDRPDLERKPDGTLREVRKYLSPPARGNLLYFPPGVDPAILGNPDLPLVLTEGEKKTLALWRLANHHAQEPAFLPVGLSGVWNWRGTIARQPGPDGRRVDVKGSIADLDRIVWKERRVHILFDSDARRNSDIERARRELAGELSRRGAHVFVIDLPDLQGLEKTGADDFLAHREGGPDRMLDLIHRATPFEPPSIEQILNRSGISKLTEQSSIAEIESALRLLAAELAHVDPLRACAVRDETVKRLKAAGIQAPGQMVNAALSSPREHRDTRDFPPDPEPWPDPVNGVELLDGIASVLSRFVELPLEEIQAVALWIVHTYAIDAFSVSPLLVVTSAEKRCGKTLLLEVLSTLVFRPLFASNITPAGLFRAAEKYQPTLLIDEADTYLRDNDELRGVINSGYRRLSGFVIRTVGESLEPTLFRTFGPKAIAQIGKPQDTIVDRAIIIEMRRKKPQDKCERMRPDRIYDEMLPLRRKMLRFAKDNLQDLRDLDPALPAGLNDRAQDSWGPLLAIAERAGNYWPALARESASKLSSERSEASNRVQLLKDIKEIFGQEGAERMASAEIVRRLGQMEERPWPEWGSHGRPITPRQLARMLEPFAIHPRQMKIDGTNLRGYELADFQDAFSRYLPGVISATPLPSAPTAGFREIRSATLDIDVADRENAEAASEAEGSGVADEKHGAKQD
jgi:putative DNA primase/helicase